MLRQKWILAFAVAFLTVAVAAQDASELKTQKEKFSYALGMQVGADFRKQVLDLDPGTFAKAFAESFNGAKTMLTEDEMHSILVNAKEEYRKKQAALREEKAQATLAEGEKFLAENKSKEGVVALPSGLQYKILKQGTGEKPEIDEKIVCNYRGKLLDGTEFDSSAKHNGPATFPVRGVIRGWREALLMMPTGSKWQLFVPPNLAYGHDGSGQMVPPNATLIFEVELLSVKQGEERDRE
ncbi:MAG: FKBP-type peptidyl-prolyl cis-trans isomerase [Candidatus Sulfotelmatobacter sp.]